MQLTLTLSCACKHKVAVSDVGDALMVSPSTGTNNSKDNGTHKDSKLATKGKRVVVNLAVLNINPGHPWVREPVSFSPEVMRTAVPSLTPTGGSI